MASEKEQLREKSQEPGYEFLFCTKPARLESHLTSCQLGHLITSSSSSVK